MTVFERVSFLISDSGNAQTIKNVLRKYRINPPISYNHLLLLSSNDLRVIIDAVSEDNDYYKSIISNLTLLKIYNKNKDNPLFKNKGDVAKKVIDGFLDKLNNLDKSLDDDTLASKYKEIITPVGITREVVNLDEFDQFINQESLSLRDRGEIKKEVGKANIRFAHQKLNVTYSLDMFDEANKILKKEKEILERDFSHILDSDSLSDEVLYDFRRYSILVALKSEVFKAKLNKYNEVVFNTSMKLINSYIDAYNVLIKLKGEASSLVR